MSDGIQAFALFGDIFLRGGAAVTSGLDQITSRVDSLQRGLSTIADGLGAFGRKATVGLTIPLALAGNKMVNLAADAEETENLFTVSMGKMAEAAHLWVEETSDAMKINKYSLMDNVGMLNQMLNSMGMGEEAAYEMARGITVLGYDMASFYNLKPEEAFEKLRSGMVGMARPLQDLGILVNENTIKQYAYKNGIAEAGAKLTDQQKVLARYIAIMDQTANAHGDLERTAESLTNRKRILGETATETATTFGQVLAPVMVEILGYAQKLVDWLASLDAATKENIIRVGLFAVALGPVALALSGVINVVNGLITVGRTLGTVIQWLVTGPHMLWVAGIGLIVAAIIGLWNESEAFRDAVKAIWTFIRDLVVGVATAITTVIDTVVSSAKKAIEWVQKLLGLNREAQDTMPAVPTAPDTTAAPAEMAEGGRVGRAGWSWVGEQGPELMKLPKGAEVWPLPRLAAAGQGVTVNVNNPVLFDQRMVNELGDMLVNQIRLRTGINTV